MGPLHYIATELWRTLSRHRTLCLASIRSMSSILLILLLFMMVLTGVDNYTKQLESREEISVFLNEGLSRQDVDLIAARLRVMPGADSVRFVSKDEAWGQFPPNAGNEAWLQPVPANRLPSPSVVRPRRNYR